METAAPARVQALAETGVSRLPAQYIQPPENRPTPSPSPVAAALSVPVVDLSSSTAATVGGDGGEPAPSSSTSTDDGGFPLPEHVRREILELGLPNDGYDYLAHLRELRPSLSSTGGGGSSAVFLPSRRPARSGLPVDVKVPPSLLASASHAVSSVSRGG